MRTTLKSIIALLYLSACLGTHLSADNLLLLSYARYGNFEGVKQALKEGADDIAGGLNQATRENHLPIAELLALWEPAAMYVKNEYGNAPIDLAHQQNNTALEKVFRNARKYLSTNSAPVATFRPPLDCNKKLGYCAYSGDVEGVKEALREGATALANALVMAIEMEHRYIVKLLVAWDPVVVFKQDEQKYWPLGVAAIHGHEDILLYLIEKGAGLNDVDGYNNTALMYAAQKGHYGCADLLLQRGADKEHKEGKRGRTARQLALDYKHQNIADLIDGVKPEKSILGLMQDFASMLNISSGT
jgi:ankyrin repeat protein